MLSYTNIIQLEGEFHCTKMLTFMAALEAAYLYNLVFIKYLLALPIVFFLISR